jgi:hypothetical protein
MDLLTALKILLRRWPVMLAGLVFTVFAVIQVGRMIEPTYEAKSTVLLLSPGSSTTNPFNEFGANLEVTADAIMVVLQSPVGGEKLEAAGATGGFKLERNEGPLIDIIASAPTERAATRTVEVVVAGLREELETRQASSPVDQHITVSELTQPVATPKLGSRIRAQAAVLAVGITGTVAAGLAADALMRQRQESKLRRQALAEAERDDNGYLPSHAGSQAARRMADEPAWPPAPNGTHNGAPTMPVLNGGTGNGRSSVYRPKPSRSRSEVPANGPPQPTAAPATVPRAPRPSPAPVGASGAPQPKAAPGAAGAPQGTSAPGPTGAPQGATAPPGPPAGPRRPGSLTDRLATDLSAGGRPAPDGLAERPPQARRQAEPPPSRPAGDARPRANPQPAGPQPSRSAPVGNARPTAASPAGDSRQPQDGNAAEAPHTNLP